MRDIKILKSIILNELEKLERLIDEASNLKNKRVSNIIIRAAGSIIHDFYTGIERIFHAIATNIDENIPHGISWHIELLNQMTFDIEGVRSAIITKDTAKILEEYLRFRHLFRKRYGFELEWIHIKKLLTRMPMAYTALKKDIKRNLEIL